MIDNLPGIESLQRLLAYDPSSPLLFNTGLFMLLFVAFMLVYQAMRRWPNAKMVFVILFSLYFYYKSSAEYCFILLGVCLSDYLLGLWMGAVSSTKPKTTVGSAVGENMADSMDGMAASDAGWRKWLKRLILFLNVGINLGMLVYFKYFNLLWSTFANITNTHFDALDIILPAGISFFTFRSISYLVDIYRGEIKAARNFLHYVFFLTFFPPLLAGPVVRAKDMLPQIASHPVADRLMVGEGLFLIIVGLIKKVIVADYISGNFVDRVFENPSLYTGLENALATVGFTVQLYCDFSGYSDMAIGIALLLGYRFKDNFNAPFKSQNPTEFWKRWHISLSSWLMDYLYIPLGGNRKGKMRQRINLMATMLLGGLWHGASWMYVIWGGYHGALLVAHKGARQLGIGAPKRMRKWRIVRSFNVLVTFLLVAIGFVLFRADSLDKVAEMGTAITTNFHPEVFPQFVAGYWGVVAVLVAAMIIHFLPQKWQSGVMRGYIALPLIAQAIILGLVIFLVIQMRQTSVVPFIYLQY